jgi:hypothetical protein
MDEAPGRLCLTGFVPALVWRWVFLRLCGCEWRWSLEFGEDEADAAYDVVGGGFVGGQGK